MNRSSRRHGPKRAAGGALALAGLLALGAGAPSAALAAGHAHGALAQRAVDSAIVPAEIGTVAIAADGFQPATIAVPANGLITWKNEDTKPHQVVADDGSFSSPVLQPGATFTRAFGSAATVAVHDGTAVSMKGSIVVLKPGTVAFTKDGILPSRLMATVGDRITFINTDTTSHQLAADDGSFTTPLLAPGQSYSVSLAKAGTVGFHGVGGSSASGTLVLQAPGTVAVTDAGLFPQSVTVKTGDAVTWTNTDTKQHQIVGDGFSSPVLMPGQSFTYTFGKAGTFAVKGGLSPQITGSIVAQAAAPAPAPAKPAPAPQPQVATKAPVLSGTAQVGQVLTVTPGTWSPSDGNAFQYQFTRCNPDGRTCVPIVVSFNPKYTLQAADVGHVVYVSVKAISGRGSSYAASNKTAVVKAAAGAPAAAQPAAKPAGAAPAAAAAVPVGQVALPNRLDVTGVQFTPSAIASRNDELTARFRVTDSSGRPVSGALVYAIGLPYGWVTNAAEQTTDGTGWATLTLRVTNAPAGKHSLVLFVRARKPGGSLLAGVSTRRLVQVSLNLPQ